MAKSKDVNDPLGITNYIQQLEPELASLIQGTREVLLATDKEVGEQIKWNSPSFFYTGAMKPFDPKEYKRDIVVINIRKGAALLVFPTGAIVKDSTGILEGSYTDGRRMITIKTMDDLKTKAEGLQGVVREWLKLVDRQVV